MTGRNWANTAVRRWGPAASVAGIAGVAGSFAVAGLTVHFVAAPVNTWVVENTPASVVTAAILWLGPLGELLAFAVAVVLSMLALAVATLVGASVGDRISDTAGAVLGTYFVGWAVTALFVRAPFIALGAAIPMALVVGVGARLSVRPTEHDGRRRAFLVAAGLCGFFGLSAVVGLRVVDPAASSVTAISPVERERISALLDVARERSLDIDGLEGLTTPVEAFYEVDIDAINPNLNAADWQLRVTGAVEVDQTVSYGDLTSVQPTHRFVTLRCVGEPLNGTLMVDDVLRVVSFNTLSSQAVRSLPSSIRDALPDHEALEERNGERIPPPTDGDFHALLEEANEQYPDHSLAIIPSGQVHMGGGMMMHPVALPQSATRPVVRQLGATRRGDYTLSCLTYCGYGHPYMEIDGGILVT